MCQLQNHCVTKRALSAVTGHKEPFNLSMGGHALTDGKLWSTYQLKCLGQDSLKMWGGHCYPKGNHTRNNHSTLDKTSFIIILYEIDDAWQPFAINVKCETPCVEISKVVF